MALVITLVLLSIITFMAITFLVVSRGQRSSVTTETESAIARFGADTARERAIVQLLSPILTWTNEHNYGLLVSTNFINTYGFTNGVDDPLNVNYDYDSAGAPLGAADRNRNIRNLLYDPRPPVFVTNRFFANSNDFRFYLDLNRNGRYDPSGLQPEVVQNGGALYFYDANDPRNLISYQWPPPSGIRSNYVIGDPEWIGVLQRPEFAHSPSNLFSSRYAYIVVPASQTLDINYIHNDCKGQLLSLNAANDGFLRNQGVGAWEINLAAFLADLNTNFWPSYVYTPFSGSANPELTSNLGLAFEDASRLLWYRYGGSVNNLASVARFFPGGGLSQPGANAFSQDFLDGYSAGPIMTNTWWPVTVDADTAARTASSWSGADNPNRFFTTQDLFDRSKIPPTVGSTVSFVDRLSLAGKQPDTYNSSTFYRLLSQLGTDSAPEPGGKLNVNYCNVDANGYVVPNAATNFIPWSAPQFFTNVVVRLLADAGYAVGPWDSTTNILRRGSNLVNGVWLAVTNLHVPLWPNNFYTPAVHRTMQVAANIFDSTTNRLDYAGNTTYPYVPTVFWPLFARDGSGIHLTGYREATQKDATTILSVYDLVRDLTDTNDLRDFNAASHLVYGVPLVVGAKKGFPNFNEFAMHTQFRVTRKLQFHRPGNSTSLPVNEIDQMFVVGVSNALGVEAWNSYATAFPRGVTMAVWPDISILVTNLQNGNWLNKPPLLSRARLMQAVVTNIPANTWEGYDTADEARSFQIPLATNIVFLSNGIYRRQSDDFVVLPSGQLGQFERFVGTTNFYVPQWQVKVRPRIRLAIIDNATRRLVDYVQLADDVTTNLTQALMMDGACGETYNPSGANGSMWCTNRMYGAAQDAVTVPTFGINNQLEASMGHVNADWNSSTQEFPPGMDRTAAIAFFNGQFEPGYPQSSNTFDAPFQPFRNLYFISSLQANDPLVHYTTGDLSDASMANKRVVAEFTSGMPDPVANLRVVNGRYEPWGRVRSSSLTPTVSKYEMAVKDPTSTVDRPEARSDDWDFPANRYPNAGWLGRVHRGTPWQTVYFKPNGLNLSKWAQWSGNPVVDVNVGQFSTSLVPINRAVTNAFFTQPTNDWHLLDLFTTALNDNATRSQLSINQTNLAAWSAVLSGTVTLTNTLDNNGNVVLGPQVIQPAGIYDPFDTNNWPPVVKLVNRINEFRATNSVRRVFTRLGDILGLPELTMASPFLNTTATPGMPDFALNDAAIERLPQQIMGLLKVDSVPRFVIYAFGQTLKPAEGRPFVTSGDFSGLCTNYQIVAESATRTVVRLEGVQPLQSGIPMAITNLHPVVESFTVLPPD